MLNGAILKRVQDDKTASHNDKTVSQDNKLLSQDDKTVPG